MTGKLTLNEPDIRSNPKLAIESQESKHSKIEKLPPTVTVDDGVVFRDV